MSFLDDIHRRVQANYSAVYEHALVLTLAGEVMICQEHADGTEAIVHVAFPWEPWRTEGPFNDTDRVARMWRRHTTVDLMSTVLRFSGIVGLRCSQIYSEESYAFRARPVEDLVLQVANKALREFALDHMIRRRGGTVEPVDYAPER